MPELVGIRAVKMCFINNDLESIGASLELEHSKSGRGFRSRRRG